MKLYRISKRKYASAMFSGFGASIAGGRWNSQGLACTYTSDSEALAILEVAVHLHSHTTLSSYMMRTLEISEHQVAMLDSKSIPDNWRDSPAPKALQKIGDEWLTDGTYLGLAVPSVLAPSQQNILINPQHPEFPKLLATQADIDNFLLDARLR